MKDKPERPRRFVRLFLLAAFSLSCSSITVGTDKECQTTESTMSPQDIGFDFAGHTPEFTEGDTSASLHLFLHQYPIPQNGFISGLTYLNDSDTVSESFDLLILRPDDQGWKVISRIRLSDDSPPAKTGITILSLPTPMSVQKNDIFAHWQYGVDGAIPLNADTASFNGLSIGQYGFRSDDVEIGRHISKDGFTGQRDYFINVIFTTSP